MKKRPLSSIILILAAGVSACGGGGSDSGSGIVTVPPTATTPPPPPPPPPPTTCSLLNRQNFAASVLDEWYLFPETLPSARNPSAYSTVDDYIDALTATARGQGRDRYFTYLTSIREENAYFSSGATAGFGVRLSYQGTRLFVIEAFEGAPALAAGIDRGTEIVGIGTDSSNILSLSDILAADPTDGLSNALGTSTVGLSRVLRVMDSTGTRNITLAKAEYDVRPLSSRYGVKIIDNGGGQRVGYINMRTFISTADNQLRTAFSDFRAQGITNFVIDFRYNGGGLVSTAELMGDLLGGNRSSSDIFSVTRFRASKSAENETRRFAPQAQSVSPVKIAFISTKETTASASELVMAAFVPFLGTNAALVGNGSYGKPVGQIGLDLAACDDRIRVVAFAKENAAGQGDYFSGLAGTMRTTCAADDDLTRPLGDPQEASLRTALDFVAGRSCTPIALAQSAQSAASRSERRVLAAPKNASAAQRDIPGLF
jgi:carboxyl-terminal processing protease